VSLEQDICASCLIALSGPKTQQMSRTASFQMPHVDERFVSRHSIGFGGFPGPIEIGKRLWRRISTRWEATRIGRLFRPYPSVLLPMGQVQPEELSRYETREVQYLLALKSISAYFHLGSVLLFLRSSREKFRVSWVDGGRARRAGRG
jgi:hypothetical protein